MERVKRAPAEAKRRLERARARYGWVDVGVRTAKRYGDDDCGSYAAALTYYLFFSIFPLLLFGAAALGYLTPGNTKLRRDILESGLKTVPVLSEAIDRTSLNRIEENREAIALTGLVLALYSGSGAVVALEHALNKVGHVEGEPNFLVKRARSLKWLAVLGMASVASLALSTVVGFVVGPLGAALGVLAGVAVNVGIFATAFRFLPATGRSWADVLPGSVLAAIAFEILKFAGSFYLAKGAASREQTFGALAGAAALLVASYLISQIILFAAELNEALFERRAIRRPSFEPAKEAT
jgi:inner membrane protein YhjD